MTPQDLDTMQATFPLFLDHPPLSVVVHPGQTLYIPPYWWHHVEALDLSVSVNIWSTTPASRLTAELGNNPTPFTFPSAPHDDQAIVYSFCLYTRTFLDKMDFTAREIVASVLQQYNSLSHDLFQHLPFDLVMSRVVFPDDIQRQYDEFASGIAARFNAYSDAPDVQRITLAVYVDGLANLAVGFHRVPSFLEQCFEL